MDMFGGLTKTSSRIAIASALGMTLGGFAMSSTPVKAADLGGDCCADLEERVAELEATTVRKGNKKVSVTLSGWVVKDLTWFDDKHTSGVYVGDKDTTLSSHFQISGAATIAPGWSGGYTMTIEAPGNANGFFTNQENDNTNFEGVVDGTHSDRLLRVLLSYMYIKSDRYGTINWGLLSQATDNTALLPDLSGTIIESNAVFFEGAGFFLRPKGAVGNAKGQANTVWGQFVTCLSGGGIIGVDCNGNTTNGVRYDSPTWGGFSVSGGFGENQYKDIAAKYAADWGNFKVSAAYGFTNMLDENYIFSGGGLNGKRTDINYNQVGASVMHVPSGLFIYGMYEAENAGGTLDAVTKGTFQHNVTSPDAWYLKGGIKRTWTPLGATVLYGEYGRYNDEYSTLVGTDVCSGGGFTNVFPAVKNALGPTGPSLGSAPICFNNVFNNGVFVSGSETQRWGLGVVQEIDAAAMHVFARWQHQDVDVNFVGFDVAGACSGGCKANQSFDSLDLFQVGGVIFF
ncbi:MAG: porin [Methyloceanibacter sp.]|nr:porin [Methyloceanibacter sp.]